MEQKIGILEQIEVIQKLAEQLEKDSRELTQEIFSFENISKMCSPYYLEKTRGKLSKCCNAEMQEGTNQCLNCGTNGN